MPLSLPDRSLLSPVGDEVPEIVRDSSDSIQSRLTKSGMFHSITSGYKLNWKLCIWKVTKKILIN